MNKSNSATKIVIIVCGLPGSGKTYFANHLAEHLDAKHISSDRVRDELGMKGQYKPQNKDAVYDEMLKRMQEACNFNNIVIIDATFFSQHIRQRFLDVIKEVGARHYIIEIVASDRVIQRRVTRKREESEADYDVYLKLKNSFDPIQHPHLTISSDDEDINQMIRQATDYMEIEQ